MIDVILSVPYPLPSPVHLSKCKHFQLPKYCPSLLHSELIYVGWTIGIDIIISAPLDHYIPMQAEVGYSQVLFAAMGFAPNPSGLC